MSQAGATVTAYRPLVPAVCANCGKPVRIWGGWYYGEAEPDGRGGWRAPVARMWGGTYVHGDCRTQS
jgi:hypothetical protein